MGSGRLIEIDSLMMVRLEQANDVVETSTYSTRTSLSLILDIPVINTRQNKVSDQNEATISRAKV